MKKRVHLWVCALLMCIAVGFSAMHVDGAVPQLYDGADLLTESEENLLRVKLESVSETCQVELAVAFVPSAGGITPGEYVECYYDENGLGYGADRDGVLLLVAMEEREYKILSNGLGARAVSPDDIEYIGDRIQPYLSAGAYAEAVHTFVDECEYEINVEVNGFPFDFGGTLLTSLIVGFVSAFIATGIMKRKLKSVRSQSMASEYTKRDSLVINSANELFLYRTVNRQRKENNNASRSSGHSRSSGGSRHVGGGRF